MRAAAELRNRMMCRFVLAGDGPSLEDVKALAKDLGVEDIVSFPGTLDTEEIQRLLVGADLFVQASLWEGMPAAVLEAMAAGVAVVGNRCQWDPRSRFSWPHRMASRAMSTGSARVGNRRSTLRP